MSIHRQGQRNGRRLVRIGGRNDHARKMRLNAETVVVTGVTAAVEEAVVVEVATA